MHATCKPGMSLIHSEPQINNPLWFCTDASLCGISGFYERCFFYATYPLFITKESLCVNALEIVTVTVGVKLWAPVLSCKCILVLTWQQKYGTGSQLWQIMCSFHISLPAWTTCMALSSSLWFQESACHIAGTLAALLVWGTGLVLPIPCIPNSDLSPVKALQGLFQAIHVPTSTSVVSYISMAQWSDCLTAQTFRSSIQSLVFHISLDPSNYSGQRLRHGSATFAFQCGIPVELINMQGNWRLDTYFLYLMILLADRLNLFQILTSHGGTVVWAE